MIHFAGEHPLDAGAAKTLLTGVAHVGPGRPQRGQGALVPADPYHLATARQLQLERRPVDHRQRREPFDVQLRAPIERDAPTDGLHHRRRATHVHRRPPVHPVQELGGGRQAVLVVGAHPHLVSEREQLYELIPEPQDPPNETTATPPSLDRSQVPWDQRWTRTQYRSDPSEQIEDLVAQIWPDPDFSAVFRIKAGYLLAARAEDHLALPAHREDPLAEELAALVYSDLRHDGLPER